VKASGTRHEVRRPNLKHGLHTLKKAVQVLGSRALPPRSTALGRALHEWRASLVADVGGEDANSTQQLALVELAVRTKLLVDSVDAYVLGMPSPVNRQRRCVSRRPRAAGAVQTPVPRCVYPFPPLPFE